MCFMRNPSNLVFVCIHCHLSRQIPSLCCLDAQIATILNGNALFYLGVEEFELVGVGSVELTGSSVISVISGDAAFSGTLREIRY